VKVYSKLLFNSDQNHSCEVYLGSNQSQWLI